MPDVRALVVYESIYGNTRAVASSFSRKAAVQAGEDDGAEIAGVDRESFYVEDSEGPLAEGELERARSWGANLADMVGP